MMPIFAESLDEMFSSGDSSSAVHLKFKKKHDNLHPSSCKGTAADIERMQHVLDKDPGALNRVGYRDKVAWKTVWKPPLYAACKQLHKDCVAFLLNAGARIYIETGSDLSIIDSLIGSTKEVEDWEQEFVDILILIVEKCSNSTKIYPKKHIMFRNMCQIITDEVNRPLQFLLEHGVFCANVKIINSNIVERVSPFGIAIEFQNLTAMKLLILHGVNLANYIRTGTGRSPLSVHIIQHCSAPIALCAVKLVRNFGVSLSSTHYLSLLDSQKTIMELVQEKKWSEQQICELENMIDEPLTLLELSRMSLQKSFGANYWQNINSIEIPQEVKSFLLLNDI